MQLGNPNQVPPNQVGYLIFMEGLIINELGEIIRRSDFNHICFTDTRKLDLSLTKELRKQWLTTSVRLDMKKFASPSSRYVYMYLFSLIVKRDFWNSYVRIQGDELPCSMAYSICLELHYLLNYCIQNFIVKVINWVSCYSQKVKQLRLKMALLNANPLLMHGLHALWILMLSYR